MQNLTYDECVELLLSILDICKGNKDLQAKYLQSFVQQYGPIPDKYGDEVRELIG